MFRFREDFVSHGSKCVFEKSTTTELLDYKQPKHVKIRALAYELAFKYFTVFSLIVPLKSVRDHPVRVINNFSAYSSSVADPDPYTFFGWGSGSVLFFTWIRIHIKGMSGSGFGSVTKFLNTVSGSVLNYKDPPHCRVDHNFAKINFCSVQITFFVFKLFKCKNSWFL